MLVMDGHRPRGHRLLRVGVDRIFLIGNLNGLEGPLGSDLVLGHHHGDVIAIDTHPLAQELPVGHILMGLLHAPGVAWGRVLNIRGVKAGEDLHHAGHLLGLGEVHTGHYAVGDGAM